MKGGRVGRVAERIVLGLLVCLVAGAVAGILEQRGVMVATGPLLLLAVAAAGVLILLGDCGSGRGLR